MGGKWGGWQAQAKAHVELPPSTSSLELAGSPSGVVPVWQQPAMRFSSHLRKKGGWVFGGGPRAKVTR